MTDPVAAAFARIAAGDGEEALDDAARAVTERAEDLVAGLTDRYGWASFWRERAWATVEVVHALRASGRITDVDEVYRIWAINERLASAASDGLGDRAMDEDDGAVLTRFHNELLFDVAPDVPAGHAMPDAAPVAGAVLARGVARPVDRITEAIDGWRAAIDAGRADGLDERAGMDRGEHARAHRLITWAQERGLLSADECDRMRAAIGERRETGGWPAGTEAHVKAAVTDIVGGLHTLFNARYAS